MTPADPSDSEDASSEPPEQVETTSAKDEQAERSGAEQDTVNSQVTDAITQALKAVLDTAPPVAL